MATKVKKTAEQPPETLSARQLITLLLSTNLDDLVFLRADDNNSASGLTSVQFFTMDVEPKVDLELTPVVGDEVVDLADTKHTTTNIVLLG